MIVETKRFNPSFCTCGEHDCEPRYRMERRVLWTNKEIVTNERKQNTEEIHQVKYTKEIQETSEKGKNIEGADRKCEDHIRRNKDEDVQDGEKADHDKMSMEDCYADNFEGCVASLVNSYKIDGNENMGNTGSNIEDNGERGDNGDCNDDGKSLKDDTKYLYKRLSEASDINGFTFSEMIYERDKGNNGIEAKYVNKGGSGPNENYSRDIDRNKGSLVRRKHGNEENDSVTGKENDKTDDYKRDHDNNEKNYKYDKENNEIDVVGVRSNSWCVEGMNHEIPANSTANITINESHIRNVDDVFYDIRNELTGFRDNTGETNDIGGTCNDCNDVIDGGKVDVAADDVCKNGAVGKCFVEEGNGEKSDDDAFSTNTEIKSSSDGVVVRNDESDRNIVTSEVGTYDETGEQTFQCDGWHFQDDEISPDFGIMSVYCNSKLHSW